MGHGTILDQGLVKGVWQSSLARSNHREAVMGTKTSCSLDLSKASGCHCMVGHLHMQVPGLDPQHILQRENTKNRIPLHLIC